jgi:hypothetical protein
VYVHVNADQNNDRETYTDTYGHIGRLGRQAGRQAGRNRARDGRTRQGRAGQGRAGQAA